MLTKEEKNKIAEEMSHMPSAQASIIDALNIVQDAHGHVSDEDMKELADFMQVSISELESVATFYNLVFRKDPGEHVISVCDSISCFVCGSDEVMQTFAEKLDIRPGETTKDKKITLLPTVCLGYCEKAPAISVDGEIITNVSPEKAREILKDLTGGGS